jgi:hypothetical protein
MLIGKYGHKYYCGLMAYHKKNMGKIKMHED